MTVESVWPVDDARARTDGLGWMTAALHPDSRVRVRLESARTARDDPPGWLELTRHAVVPSASHPRFLVPLGSHRVAAASLLAFNALRPRKVRVARQCFGALARIGGIHALPFPRLTVSAPDDVVGSEVILAEHLAVALDMPTLSGACGVRPADPNHKPTLQLFDPHGRPVGFAKVGWNPATRALVAAEAAALGSIDSSPAGFPIVPRVLLAGEWSGQTILVLEPLPHGVRGRSSNEPAPVTEALVIARRGGPSAPAHRLDESSYFERLSARSSAPGVANDVGDRLAQLVARLAERYGSVQIEFGDWHGDWVPWNLGTFDGRLVAWDWEHSGIDVPVGVDVAHHGFQRSFVLDQQDVVVAANAAGLELAECAGPLRTDATQRDLILVTYLFEMWLRTHRLAHGGAGWNTRLHPALLDEIQRRLA